MAIYQIKYTNGGKTITIQPGQLNGPNGTSGTTDLDLYGQGTLNWGKGVDQNQLRLLENFACPQSNSSTTPRPVNKDESVTNPVYNGDGVSTGINNPIKGQLWYNTTDEKLYVCNDATAKTWEIAGSDPDLFLALTGGTLSGNLSITNGGSPTLELRSTGSTTNSGNKPAIEIRDAQGLKGSIELVQDPSVEDTSVLNPFTGLGYADDADHLVITKENGSQWIAQLRIQDDGVVVRKGTGSQLGNGTIRVSEPITAAHHGSTLVTKDYVAGSGYVQRSGDTMTGTLVLESTNPRLYLKATNNTQDANLEFYGNDETGPKGILYLDQRTDGNDRMSWVLRKAGVTDTNITLIGTDDNSVGPWGRVGISGLGTGSTLIWTDGPDAGKIQTPSTATGDSGFTLVTKDWMTSSGGIEGAGFVSLGQQTNGMTGRYRFGIDHADTVIDGASFKSLNNTDTDIATTIIGNAFKTQTSSTVKTEITSAFFKSTNGSGILEITGSLLKSSDSGDTYTQINQQNVSIQTSTGRLSTFTGPIFTSTTDASANNGTTTIHGNQLTVSDGTSGASTFIRGNYIRHNDGAGFTELNGATVTMDGSGSALGTINPNKILLDDGNNSIDINTLGSVHSSFNNITHDSVLASNNNAHETKHRYATGGGGLSFKMYRTENFSILQGQMFISDGESRLDFYGGHNFPSAQLKLDDDIAQLRYAGPSAAGNTAYISRVNCNDGSITLQLTGGTWLQIEPDQTRINKPLQLENAAGNAIHSTTGNAPQAVRIYNQNAKPIASHPFPPKLGDLWFDTNIANGAIYVRATNTAWRQFDLGGLLED